MRLMTGVVQSLDTSGPTDSGLHRTDVLSCLPQHTVAVPESAQMVRMCDPYSRGINDRKPS